MAGLIPTRTDDPAVAADLLDRDGTAVLTGRGTDAVAAAALAGDVLGPLLARPDASAVREGGEGDTSLIAPGETMPVHVDGFAYGDRHPDGLFLLCAEQGATGGASMVVDGHRLLATVAEDDPELFAFVHDEPVDLTEPRMHPTISPIVLTLPSGRRALRRSPYMAPAPRAADPERDRVLIERWKGWVQHAGEAAPRFSLRPGEALCLDNYRMFHGRGSFTGERMLWRIWAWTPRSNGVPAGPLHSDSRYAATS
ncbi:MAG TPA: TauD/TfdA family dioxygenase [Iamia sp.]|nr:TauD/TfdA family dioxygenase [Iamia sp.]